MKRFVGPLSIVFLLLVSSVSFAQAPPRDDSPWRRSPAAGQPGQQIVPKTPTLERRPPAPKAPFTLTPQQQSYIDQVLAIWEQHSAKVKTFDCTFRRWEYDRVFGGGNKPVHVEDGEIKYESPDKGSFKLTKEKTKDDKWVDVSNDRAQHWVCDGNSIFSYNYRDKRVEEHQLPENMRGKAISDGPLPFIFGAKAESLKRRYFIRAVAPPPEHAQTQIWIEAYPRTREDAANFVKAELILTAKDMQPHALQLHDPNGKSWRVYAFGNISINAWDPLKGLKTDIFTAPTPFGWTKVVQPPATPAPVNAAAGRGPER